MENSLSMRNYYVDTKRQFRIDYWEDVSFRWSDLPFDILSQIIKPLPFIAQIRACVICKNWRTLLVRDIHVPRIPWYLTYNWFVRDYARQDPQKEEDSISLRYTLSDPSNVEKKPYIVIKDIHGDVAKAVLFSKNKHVPLACATRYGWVMFFIEKSSSSLFILFNLFTKKMFTLPDHDSQNFDLVTFSASPSSRQECVYFVLDQSFSNQKIKIQTCRYGDKRWTTKKIYLYGLKIEDMAYIHPFLYCVSSTGPLATFSVASKEWKELTKDDRLKEYECRDCHLVESKGEVLLVAWNKNDRNIGYLFQFDRNDKKWATKEVLEDEALYIGKGSSFSISTVEEELKAVSNQVFSGHSFQFPMKTCPWGKNGDGSERRKGGIWSEGPLDIFSFVTNDV